ncbi:MAG TPA: DnaD domain protein [Anaerolineales bacterium]
MNRIWIKLYLEILDDPKMGGLPDWQWRRAVELFLLAGGNGNDGGLRPVADLAWRLRISEEKMTEALLALSRVGVVHEASPGCWVVTHFAERQASPSTPRVQRFRERARQAESAALAEEESIEPSPAEPPEYGGVGTAEVTEVYQENIGALNQYQRRDLQAAVETYSARWVLLAIRYALMQNKCSLAYVLGTLKGWKQDGLQDPAERFETYHRLSRPEPEEIDVEDDTDDEEIKNAVDESDQEDEKDQPVLSDPHDEQYFRAYEDQLGPMRPEQWREVREYLEEDGGPREWLPEVVSNADKHGIHRWSYVINMLRYRLANRNDA